MYFILDHRDQPEEFTISSGCPKGLWKPEQSRSGFTFTLPVHSRDDGGLSKVHIRGLWQPGLDDLSVCRPRPRWGVYRWTSGRGVLYRHGNHWPLWWTVGFVKADAWSKSSNRIHKTVKSWYVLFRLKMKFSVFGKYIYLSYLYNYVK